MTVVLTTLESVENYVNQQISNKLLDGKKVSFIPNPDISFGCISSRCILDRATELKKSPQELAPEFLKLIDDPRFSEQHGFLNFNGSLDKNWLLTSENYQPPGKLKLFVLDDKKERLCTLRLKLICLMQSFLANPLIDLANEFNNFAGEEDEIASYIDNQKTDIYNQEIINIWCSPKGLSTKLFNKIIYSKNRAQEVLAFQVLPKVFSATKMFDIEKNYEENLLNSPQVLKAAAYYFSCPYQASEIDLDTPYLDENANLYKYGKRILTKLESFSFPQTNLSDLDSMDFKGISNGYMLILRSLKLLPLRFNLAVSKGEVFTFTQELKHILVFAEKLINTPSFRAQIISNQLTQVDLFILSSIQTHLRLFFNI